MSKIYNSAQLPTNNKENQFDFLRISQITLHQKGGTEKPQLGTGKLELNKSSIKQNRANLLESSNINNNNLENNNKQLNQLSKPSSGDIKRFVRNKTGNDNNLNNNNQNIITENLVKSTIILNPIGNNQIKTGQNLTVQKSTIKIPQLDLTKIRFINKYNNKQENQKDNNKQQNQKIFKRQNVKYNIPQVVDKEAIIEDYLKNYAQYDRNRTEDSQPNILLEKLIELPDEKTRSTILDQMYHAIQSYSKTLATNKFQPAKQFIKEGKWQVEHDKALFNDILLIFQQNTIAETLQTNRSDIALQTDKNNENSDSDEDENDTEKQGQKEEQGKQTNHNPIQKLKQQQFVIRIQKKKNISDNNQNNNQNKILNNNQNNNPGNNNNNLQKANNFKITKSKPPFNPYGKNANYPCTIGQLYRGFHGTPHNNGNTNNPTGNDYIDIKREINNKNLRKIVNPKDPKPI